MENLTKVIDSLKIEDLKTTEEVKPVENLIEPTEAEIKLIVTALKDGKEYKEIKKTIRRVEMDGDKQISAKGFSYGQIKEIDLARQEKIVELTPKEEPVIEAPAEPVDITP